MKFYIAVDGHHEGPFDIEQLKARGITRSTLVWNEMMSGWTAAGDVPFLVDNLFNAPNTPRCPEVETGQPGTGTGANNCGTGYPRDERPFTAPGDYRDYNYAPPRPSTWMVPAILATVLCCLPLGIVSIIYASKVNNYYNEGKYDEAQRASNTARNWFIGSVVSSVVAVIVYLIMIIFVLGISPNDFV